MFVGNSITYHNDLPTQFAAIATATRGAPVEVEMIAGGGERIDQHEARGVVQRELASGRYSALVLQEWGSGLLCDPDLAKLGFDCAASHAAHRALVDLARHDGVRVVLLGTYQRFPPAAEALADAEAGLARELGVQHVSLREFPALSAKKTDLPWIDSDGVHPGPELTLLMAWRLTDTLYGNHHLSAPSSIRYRDYRGNATPKPDALASAQNIPAETVERRIDAEDIRSLSP